MTLATRYNVKAKELMPASAHRLSVPPYLTTHAQIDDHVFGRSEYLAGMAAVILAIIEREEK